MSLIVLFGAVGTILLYTYHRGSIEPKVPENSVYQHLPTTRLEIKGMRYDGHLDGNRVLSIVADRFSIEKKKLGFFRFGLLNVAKFENAFIKVYGSRRLTEKRRPEDSKGQNHVENSGSYQYGLTFKGAFSKKSLPNFPVKNISSVVLEPVTVELYNKKNRVTRITASAADFRLKGQRVSFDGAVKVTSGDRQLSADRVDFYPEHGVLKTRAQFSLTTPLKNLEGSRLITNIFLIPINR